MESFMLDNPEIWNKAFEYYQPLRKVEECVRQEGLAGLTLRKAAAVAGMETTHFSDFFHHKVGIPFKDWRRRARIKWAVEMLSTGDNSITQIALEVGFGSLVSFERAFRSLVGTTPRAFRDRVKPESNR
jgi:AraC family transcriptional regulator